MKMKFVGIAGVLAALLSALTLPAWAAGGAGVYDVRTEAGYVLTPQTADRTAVPGSAVEMNGSETVFYTGAERFALTYPDDSTDFHLVMALSGKSRVPTVDNLVYIDQTSAADGAVTFNVFPSALKEGEVYTIYTARSNGAAAAAATFRYGAAPAAPAAPEIEIIPDSISGHSLVLVYTNGDEAYSYDGAAMYDVTAAGYQYQGAAYAHVYGLAAAGLADKALVAQAPAPAGVLESSLDVNGSGTADLRDAVAVSAVYNGDPQYLNGHMDIVLKADVNRDKQVNALDFGLIKAEYMK